MTIIKFRIIPQYDGERFMLHMVFIMLMNIYNFIMGIMIFYYNCILYDFVITIKEVIIKDFINEYL